MTTFRDCCTCGVAKPLGGFNRIGGNAYTLDCRECRVAARDAKRHNIKPAAIVKATKPTECKSCRTCGLMLNITEFSVANYTSHSRVRDCRACRRVVYQERYQERLAELPKYNEAQAILAPIFLEIVKVAPWV